MLTGPDLARRIKPMLDYLYAGGIPVFASSHVLGGHLDPQRDRDLEGVRLCDLPAVLNRQAENAFRALGYDAGLLSLLGVELGKGRLSLEGRTGGLQLSVGGRVIRTLACVRFQEGQPVPLPTIH
jgi:outer membrane PBP1 activator LpoA protein